MKHAKYLFICLSKKKTKKKQERRLKKKQISLHYYYVLSDVILPGKHRLFVALGLVESRSTSSFMPLGFRPFCDVIGHCFIS